MIKTVLFDQDGVLIDTERHGHRIAFNRAFAEMGCPDVHWSENLYRRLLRIAGGKERIRHYFEAVHQGADKPADVHEFARNMHKRKTDIFLDMLPGLPPRPGVRRFLRLLRDRGMNLGVCTTSDARVAAAIAERIFADVPFALVIAGDMVAKKKPDPEIYLQALEKLHCDPRECLVVEDSRIGVRAAKDAGCWVLATYNDYTEQEDLSAADFIVSCLGEPDGEKTVVKKERFPIAPAGVVGMEIIEGFL